MARTSYPSPRRPLASSLVHTAAFAADLPTRSAARTAPGISTTRGERGIPVKKRKAYWIVYLPGSPDQDTVTSPLMNQYYDALSNALLPPLGSNARQTLGGLCVNCYEDGTGLADEGLLSTPSLIVIPITILNGI